MAYASLDDINAHLPDNVVTADAVNTKTISISVERVIRSYLARVFTPAEMDLWTEPDNTPDTVREVASMLAAAELYFISVAATSLDLDIRNIGQILYDRAMAMLQGILDGSLPLTPGEPSSISFYPDKTASRMFSVDMEFG